MAQEATIPRSRGDILKQAFHRGVIDLKTLLTMPSLTVPTLPETWLNKLGLTSWVGASIVVGLRPGHIAKAF